MNLIEALQLITPLALVGQSVLLGRWAGRIDEALRQIELRVGQSITSLESRVGRLEDRL